MLRARPKATVVAFAAGIAIAAQAAAVAPAEAASPTITIKATSHLKAVTGDVFVVFQAGKFSNATIHGSVSGATTGEVATLFARTFPYTTPFKALGSVTLNPTSTSTPYSFAVTPTLATRYKVELFANSTSTTPLATSAIQNVYVSVRMRSNGAQLCGRPVCHETFRIRIFLPNSALRFEMRQRLYPYFAVNLSPTREPPPPRYVFLNGGNATVSAAHRISGTEFERTLRFSFTINNDGYHWAANWCLKDFVTKVGLGLPGHHGCGDTRIPRKIYYLG